MDHPLYLSDDDEQARFISAIRKSNLLFDRVESLTLRGGFTAIQLPQILVIFPALQNLCIRELSINSFSGDGKHSTIFDVLSTEFCPRLRPLSLFTWILPHRVTVLNPVKWSSHLTMHSHRI
jgi:hypothetical protein